MKLSANLGFLWRDRPLPDAIEAAKSAGFDAVECHFPFDVASADVSAALKESALPMLSLNTWPGDHDAGEFGLCAVPGREGEARAAIEQAIGYAADIGCRAVHVMAGRTSETEGADTAYRKNLDFACGLAAAYGITILIEPINQQDVRGYHMSSIDDAAGIIGELGQANLRIMADCYHLQIIEGDAVRAIGRHLPLVCHIQIAAVPDRHEPDHGDLDYAAVAAALSEMGYDGYLGAEYHPRREVEAGLGWMEALRAV
jgi:hydroxypyruvate isomerase